jgi:hypothetical protein
MKPVKSPKKHILNTLKNYEYSHIYHNISNWCSSNLYQIIRQMTKSEVIYPVKNVYKNLPGVGKIKILTKDKPYDSIFGNYSGLKIRIVTDDLGNQFQINKSKLFYTKVKRRDSIINQLLD